MEFHVLIFLSTHPKSSMQCFLIHGKNIRIYLLACNHLDDNHLLFRQLLLLLSRALRLQCALYFFIVFTFSLNIRLRQFWGRHWKLKLFSIIFLVPTAIRPIDLSMPNKVVKMCDVHPTTGHCVKSWGRTHFVCLFWYV